MALTVTITKAVPQMQSELDFNVPINVKIKNDANEIIFEKDYSERWCSALGMDNKIKTKFQNKIKVDWDIYKAEQAEYNAAQFDTLVSALETAANAYVNQ